MERDWMNLSWQSLVVRGGVGIVFGVLAMVWPVSTAIALALLFGFWALVDGVGALAQAFQKDATGRVWLAVMGALSLVVAFVAIFHPAVTAAALTWVLGIWLVIRGIFELVGAFASSTLMPRWLLVVGGLLSLVLGVLFVANPGGAAVALAFWLGLIALAWGIAFVVLGFVVRNEQGHLHHAATPPPATA